MTSKRARNKPRFHLEYTVDVISFCILEHHQIFVFALYKQKVFHPVKWGTVPPKPVQVERVSFNELDDSIQWNFVHGRNFLRLFSCAQNSTTGLSYLRWM